MKLALGKTSGKGLGKAMGKMRGKGALPFGRKAKGKPATPKRPSVRDAHIVVREVRFVEAASGLVGSSCVWCGHSSCLAGRSDG